MFTSYQILQVVAKTTKRQRDCFYTRPQGAHYKPKVPFHRSRWCAFVGGCGCLCVPQRPFSCHAGTTVNIPHTTLFLYPIIIATHGLSCRWSEGRHHCHAALNDIVHRALASAKIPSHLDSTVQTESGLNEMILRILLSPLLTGLKSVH